MRARILFLLPLVLAGVSAAALRGTNAPDDDLDLRIDAAARGLMRSDEALGLVLSADLGGRSVFCRAWGAAPSMATSVRAGALTETFLAICALQLADEKKLALDAPVAKLLPDLALDEERIAGRSAGGTLAGGRVHVAWYAGVDLAIAVVSDSPDARIDLLERRVARMLLGLQDPDVLDEPLAVAERQRFVGSYYVGCSEYRVGDDGEHLVVHPPAGAPYALLFQGGLRFKSAANPETELEFCADGERVYGMYLTERGSRVEGRRM